MGEFFGTDGIRGVAGKHPLNEPMVERFGLSLTLQLTKQLGRPPLIIIGRDTRESGPWIESAITRGITSGGGTARHAGVITTPGVAYLTRLLNADAGVVISASHNPFEDNGIKVFSPSGRKIDDETEAAIERDLNAPSHQFSTIKPATITPADSLKESYLDFLVHEIAGLDLTGLRLVVDCANGAAFELGPRLFQRLGAQIIPLNVDPNGRNINLDCGSLHPETLQAQVKTHQAHVGIAFDGDADRLLLVDELAQIVDGDQVLFIVADYLATQNQLQGKRVVATVMSNMGLEVALRERGISMARTNVGDKYVLEELLANGGSLGGEQSGHIIFPEISLAGDGMISALEVLRVMRATDKPLSQLASGFTRYPQVTINVRVKSKPALDTIAPVHELINAATQALGNEGRVLVRYSGTENKARVMLEGRDEQVIQQHAQAIAAAITQQLG